jgi:hypothetical protein
VRALNSDPWSIQPNSYGEWEGRLEHDDRSISGPVDDARHDLAILVLPTPCAYRFGDNGRGRVRNA